METVTVYVEETTGEQDDVNEENLKLVFAKSALHTLDVHAPFSAQAFADFGFTALAPTGGDVEVDLQETTGEAHDPNEEEVEVVVPKALFDVVPTVGSAMNCFTTGKAIIIPTEPVEEAPPAP